MNPTYRTLTAFALIMLAIIVTGCYQCNGLAASTNDFNGWSAYPEVGNSEHGGERRGEDD